MNNIDIQLGNLDFESIKTSIIEHLKTQTVLKDYDYEGSAAQVLLDILAYNTLYYGYYVNMIANEMFLDTAQKEESIISLVKPLGYVVPGKTSAKANIKIRHGGSGNPSVPIYTKFTGNSSSGTSYNFYTLEGGILDDDGENIFTVTEGKSITVEQPILIDNITKKGFIFGLDVDISTIRVEVFDDVLNEWKPWTLVNNIQGGLNESSKVYWLERTELGFFIVFGGNFDSEYGQVGQVLTPNQQVRVSYLKSSGTKSNNIGKFTVKDILPLASTETLTLSSGGTDGPNIEAIRFFAPKWFASQNRAVTVDDCRGILAEAGFVGDDGDPYSRFTVWGGEEMDPPRYGRLFVSLNEANTIDPYGAANAIDILEKKTCVTIIPEFMNLDYNEVWVEGTLMYEPLRSTHTEGQLYTLVTERIKNLYPARFNLENVDMAHIVNEINSIDPSLKASSDKFTLKLIKTLTNFIEPKSFNNKCKKSSLYTKLFTPSQDAREIIETAVGNIPLNAKISLISEGDLDRQGFQLIKATYSSGATNINWIVGRWRPIDGLVNITDNVSDENNLKVIVSPDYDGTERFYFKNNMYHTGVTTTINLEHQN